MNHTIFSWVAASGAMIGSFFASQPVQSQPHCPSGNMEHCPRMVCPQRQPWYGYSHQEEELPMLETADIPMLLDNESRSGTEPGGSTTVPITTEATTTEKSLRVTETEASEESARPTATTESTTDNTTLAPTPALPIPPRENRLPHEYESSSPADEPTEYESPIQNPAAESASENNSTENADLNREPTTDATDTENQNTDYGYGTDSYSPTATEEEARPTENTTEENSTEENSVEDNWREESLNQEPSGENLQTEHLPLTRRFMLSLQDKLHQFQHTELGCRLQVRALQAKEQVGELIETYRFGYIPPSPLTRESELSAELHPTPVDVTKSEPKTSDAIESETDEAVHDADPAVLHSLAKVLHHVGNTMHAAASRLENLGHRIGQRKSFNSEEHSIR